MGGLALLSLIAPGAWHLISQTTVRAVAQPHLYLAGVMALLIFFAVWSRRKPVAIGRQSLWLSYLLFISIAEEITFRLVLPNLLAAEISFMAAVVASNLLFAVIHYFTLRWRAINCVVTFFGGMGLSHLMGQGDLVIVILAHWLGTFLNTPAPPSQRKSSAGNRSGPYNNTPMT